MAPLLNMAAVWPTNFAAWVRRCGRINWVHGRIPSACSSVWLKNICAGMLIGGAIRPDGTLRQSITASGSPEVLERYISTGATYWAIQAFSGLWALADDDPFWTAEEEPLPAEREDFLKVFPIPGWVFKAHEGHVQQFNAAVVHPGYGNKYAKLVYSSRHLFNVGIDAGQPSLDSCLCLNEGGLRQQREEILAYAVDESGCLRTRYPIEVNGHRHIVDTTLIPLGDIHLRAHRITLDPAADQGTVTAEEGSAPLGYDAGAVPVTRSENGWQFIAFGNSAVGLLPIQGYPSAAQVVAGSPNSVYGHNLLAVLKASALQPQHDLICAVYAGDFPDAVQLPTIEQAGWEADGRFVAQVNGSILSVPPLQD